MGFVYIPEQSAKEDVFFFATKLTVTNHFTPPRLYFERTELLKTHIYYEPSIAPWISHPTLHMGLTK